MLKEFISNLSACMWGTPFILLLVITSVYLTFKLGFPQVKILLAIKGIFEKAGDNKKDKITSFKSLMTVLAGTLGTGNITGVASAIAIGGIGSVFWLLVSGILSMVISYAENYIVLANRKQDKYNGYYGGTMYVLRDVLNKPKLAILFASIVAISAISIGTMTQSNSLSTILNITTGINKPFVGIITAYIVFGGKRRIAKASSIVIPFCTITYILLCLWIMCMNKEGILPGIKEIVSCAFGTKQILGGVTGLAISKVIGVGFARGMFSSEAGMGSAPIFTATVEENNINEQAKIAATSVVIDTIILCVLTGLTIASTGNYMTQDTTLMLKNTFSAVPYGNTILNICMVFFVIATIPCWEYYGEQATKYLFKSNLLLVVFRLMYIIGVYVGSIMIVDIIWDLSGIANAIMTIPNIYMVIMLADSMKNDLQKSKGML